MTCLSNFVIYVAVTTVVDMSATDKMIHVQHEIHKQHNPERN